MSKKWLSERKMKEEEEKSLPKFLICIKQNGEWHSIVDKAKVVFGVIRKNLLRLKRAEDYAITEKNG